MLCRVPVGGIARYGRPLKKRVLELAERKFVAICGKRLEAAHVDMDAVRLAAQELATATGTGAALLCVDCI